MNKISFLKLNLIIFAILIIAGSSYAGLRIWEDIEKINQPLIQPLIVKYQIKEKSEASAEKLEITEIDTSNWKTYRNEEYGFEIRYPEDWIVHQSGNKISSPSFDWDYQGDSRTTHKIKDHHAEVFIHFIDSSEGLPLNILAKTSKVPFPCSSEELDNINISNVQGIKCNQKIVGGWGYYFKITQIFLPFKTKDLLIGLKVRGELDDANQKRYLTTLNQILLTFKLPN